MDAGEAPQHGAEGGRYGSDRPAPPQREGYGRGGDPRPAAPPGGDGGRYGGEPAARQSERGAAERPVTGSRPPWPGARDHAAGAVSAPAEPLTAGSHVAPVRFCHSRG